MFKISQFTVAIDSTELHQHRVSHLAMDSTESTLAIDKHF